MTGSLVTEISQEQEPPDQFAPPLPNRIPSLDGIRAVAIGLVLVSHSLFSLKVHTYTGVVVAGWLGGTGVDVFFVLSGFLITILLLKEWDKTASLDLKRFYTRRAFRILPPFYLLLVTIFVLQRAHILLLPTKEIVYAGLFLFNYSHGGNTWINHAWTLSVEEQFYLLWPLTLLLLRPARARWAAVALIVLVPIGRIAMLLALPPQHYLVQRMSMLAHARFDTLMFGCALALFWTSNRFQRTARQFFRMGGMPLALLSAFVICPLANWRWPATFNPVAGFSIMGFSLAVLILYFVQNPGGLGGRGLNLPIVAHLGIISYSVYLWQQIFLNPKNTTFTGRFPFSLLAVLAIAELSYWCVERPSLRIRDRLERRYFAAGSKITVQQLESRAS